MDEASFDLLGALNFSSVDLIDRVLTKGESHLPLRQAFSTLGLLAVHARKLFVAGGRSVHWRLCSIFVLYPLDASSTPFPFCDNQRCLQTLPNVCSQKTPGGKPLLYYVMLEFRRFTLLFHLNR